MNQSIDLTKFALILLLLELMNAIHCNDNHSILNFQIGFYPEGHFDIVENFGNLEDFSNHMSSSIPAGKTTFVRFIASEG